MTTALEAWHTVWSLNVRRFQFALDFSNGKGTAATFGYDKAQSGDWTGFTVRLRVLWPRAAQRKSVVGRSQSLIVTSG